MREDMTSIVFVAHDPSAKNHTHPLYHHALQQNYEKTSFVDLSTLTLASYSKESMSLIDKNTILVTGCSTNSWEFHIIEKAKQLGAITIMIAELGFCSHEAIRFQGLTFETAPHLILTTNIMASKMFQERLDQLGVATSDTLVEVGGSVHMEALVAARALATPLLSREEVRAAYGVANTTTMLVPYFTAPDDPKMQYSTSELIATVSAAVSLALSTSPVDTPPFVVVIRPHPRTSKDALKEMQASCVSLNVVRSSSSSSSPPHFHVVLDVERFNPGSLGVVVDNSSLMLASDATLSYGSTTSLESILVGTPSGFLLAQEQWPYQATFLVEQFAYCGNIPRVGTAQELTAFLVASIDENKLGTIEDADNSKGALVRNWNAIKAQIEIQSRR